MIALTYFLADQNPHRDRSRGITAYSIALAQELLRSRRVSIHAITSASSANLGSAIQTTRIPFRTDRIGGRLVTDHFHAFAFQKRELIHYPKGFLPLFHTPRNCTLTMHDTIICHYHKHYPKMRSKMADAYWMHILKHSLSNAAQVITVSQFSRVALLDFCQEFQIQEPPITVTYQGCYGEEQAGQIHPKSDYVVALASELPHKKVDRLIEFWRIYEQRSISTPKLLLVGRLQGQLQLQALACKTIEIREVADAGNLFQVLQSARALILPSEIEGFGLPALEATYAGTPVVFVRGTAVEEILDHPVVGGFQLDDYDSFESALSDVLSLPSEHSSRLAIHLRSKYAWSEVADRTIGAYHACLER